MMFRIKFLWPVSVIATMAGGACAKVPEKNPSRSSEQTAVDVEKESVTPQGETEERKALRPSAPKAYAMTSQASFGTLPQGVGIPVGRKAPAFEVRDAEGKPASLAALIRDRTILLFFYRGGW